MKKTDALENNFQRLDEIVTKMEAGSLSLEEAFTLYQEGVELVKKCNDSLDKVEKEMLIITQAMQNDNQDRDKQDDNQ